MSTSLGHTVRGITPADLKKLEALYRIVCRNQTVGGVIVAGMPPPSQLRRWVAVEDDAPGYVASLVPNGTVVGHAHYERLRRPATRATAAFVVLGREGGLALATPLLDRLAMHGREVGLTRLVLAVSDRDEAKTTWLTTLGAERERTADRLVHWDILPIANRPGRPETPAETG